MTIRAGKESAFMRSRKRLVPREHKPLAAVCPSFAKGSKLPCDTSSPAGFDLDSVGRLASETINRDRRAQLVIHDVRPTFRLPFLLVGSNNNSQEVDVVDFDFANPGVRLSATTAMIFVPLRWSTTNSALFRFHLE